ncbi:pilus assembly protein CpaC [Steroidobacter agaridevorans]|nr:pilus assembly protein CpaC [Steroidobacter agaridevorans]
MSPSSPRSTVCALLIGLTAATASITAPAQEAGDQVIRATRSTTFSVPIYKSRIVDLPEPVKRVSIGNPDIADVLLLGDDGLYVLGKDLGATNVMLWDREDRLVSALNITVTHDLDSLKKQLATVLPGESVELWSSQRNIVLSGQVSSATKMDAAIQVARGYLEQMATAKDKIMFKQQSGGGGGEQPDKKSGDIINLMTVGGAHQVMLQVKIAEVNREAVRNLNAQFNALQNTGKWVTGGVNGGASFPDALFQPGNLRVPIFGLPPGSGNPIGPVLDEFAPDLPTINSTGLFASFLSSDFVANVVLDAYQNRGLAKILAEPTLTTLSGQDAQFLSGGSFPIPVSQDNGTIGIEFKDFGVKLSFIPLILDRGRINLKLNVSVSELANTNSVALTPIGTSAVFTIPSLTERRAASTVELSDGQTIGIAGLMNENMRSAINKFPGLGDIPILGYLFRSQSYQKGETELVIMVTPRLAKPINPAQIKLPTDAVGDPSNAAFFLGGKIEGEPKAKPAPPATPPSK